MTSHIRKLAVQAIFAGSAIATCCSSASAGPFADSWLNSTRPAYPVAPLVAPTTVGYGAYPYNAYTGYPNTSFSPVLPLSLPQTNIGALPTGAYSSQYYRVPTTYYRPVTSFDPNVGTNVTSLQPCTSYQYQAARVPLLTPAWQNYAYGNYGSTVPQNRWAPVTPTYAPNLAAPMVGSAAGQSSLSIASGFGTYGTSPVVQPNYAAPTAFAPTATVPTMSAPVMTVPPPVNPAVTSGYGGYHYGTPTTSTVLGGSSPVQPAASWSTPGPTGLPTTTYSQPTSVWPSPSTTTVGPTTYSPASVTPPYSSAAPMPGSMGLPTVPGAVSPTVIAPTTTAPVPSTTTPSSTVFPPVLPSSTSTTGVGSSWPLSTSPTTSGAIPSLGGSSAAPSSSAPTNQPSSTFDSESQVVPSLDRKSNDISMPSTTSDAAGAFQLRSIELQPVPKTSAPSLESTSPSKSESPWNRDYSGESRTPPASDSKEEAESEGLELKLNTDALRPIPAPRDINGHPDWKPSLLNARDQTAKTLPVAKML